MRKAEIYIYDSVDGHGVTAKTVSEQLNKFDPAVDLDVFINSAGGEVFEGIAIYNVLASWRGKKTVHITGVAAGIASLIAMAGDERIIYPAAHILILEPTMHVIGKDQMRDAADVLDTIRAKMIDIYAERSGGEHHRIDADMKAETFLTPDEAVKRGFCTAIANPV